MDDATAFFNLRLQEERTIFNNHLGNTTGSVEGKIAEAVNGLLSMHAWDSKALWFAVAIISDSRTSVPQRDELVIALGHLVNDSDNGDFPPVPGPAVSEEEIAYAASVLLGTGILDAMQEGLLKAASV